MLQDGKALNRLLAEICRLLQLSPTQYRSAVDKYEGVGRWLGGAGSPLESWTTSIYPQGSMALGTTVRPLEKAEHDLDLVFEVERLNVTPTALHKIVEDRLRANGLYAARLVYPAPPRCLRLRYAGDFHLDIVPARTDPERGPTAIEVPDRQLSRWVPNNPKAYKDWFEGRASALAIMEKAAVQPVPAQMASDQKPPLKLAVQLIKRNRDIVFADQAGAPSSILIYTLSLRDAHDRLIAAALFKLLAERLGN